MKHLTILRAVAWATMAALLGGCQAMNPYLWKGDAAKRTNEALRQAAHDSTPSALPPEVRDALLPPLSVPRPDGGSATVDGGTGAARGLGWTFQDAAGQALAEGGGSLADLDTFGPGWALHARVVGLADVTTPTRRGKRGSARLRVSSNSPSAASCSLRRSNSICSSPAPSGCTKSTMICRSPRGS